jgi:hypothetical protein
MSRSKSAAAEIPHSWDLEHWPVDVYPHNGGRAKYLIRTYRDELLAAGVMCRVGRVLVFVGAKYARWLAKRAAHVADFVPAPNRKPDSDGARRGPP